MLPVHGVYVLSNPAHNMVKIGMTKRHIDDRLKELNSETSNPMPFKCEVFAQCKDPRSVEMLLHSVFMAERVNGSEFFNVTVQQVYEEIKRRESSDVSLIIEPKQIPSQKEKPKPQQATPSEKELERKRAWHNRIKANQEERYLRKNRGQVRKEQESAAEKRRQATEAAQAIKNLSNARTEMKYGRAV